jgi:hypothetical protein
MEHPHWLWNPLEICEMGPGSFETGHSCCGMTQKGDPCKNVIKKETLKSGRQKLDVLAESPIFTPNLKLQLCDIARDFLCTRWHRERQSDTVGQKWYESAMTNQPRTEGPQRDRSVRYPDLRSTRQRAHHRHRPASAVESRLNTFDGPIGNPATEVDSADGVLSQGEAHAAPRTTACRIDPSTLRQGQIPWEISATRPAILEIENQNTGLRFLKLKSFTRRPNNLTQQNHEKCYICHSEYGCSEDDDPVTLHCGRCKLGSHLGCMQLWLGSTQSAYSTTCPHW